MIKIQYLHRLGNNLFQYVAARIIAERTGLALDATPGPDNHFARFVDKFRNLQLQIPGTVYDDPVPVVTDWARDGRITPLVFADHPRRIIVAGLFMHFDNFRDWLPQIREWLAFEPAPIEPHPDDLVLNIRLGDYKQWEGGRVLPFSFYRKVIEQAQPRKLYIVTDEPESTYLNQFREYEPHVFDISPFDCFRAVARFNRICISHSSFSWWAALLSDASEIYYPLTSHPPTYNDKLLVDQPRYRYVPSEECIPWNEPILFNERRSAVAAPVNEDRQFQGFEGSTEG